MLEQAQWLILTVCRSWWVFWRTCVSCHLEEQKWKSSKCNWAQTQSWSSPTILPSPAPLHSPSAVPTGLPGGVKKILALLWPSYQYNNVFLQWQTQGLGSSPSPLGCHTLAQEFLKPALLASSGTFTGFSLVFLRCGAHITHQDLQHSPFFLPYQQDITDLMGQGDFLWETQMVQMCKTIRQDARIICSTVCPVWTSDLSLGSALLNQRKSTFVQPL